MYTLNQLLTMEVSGGPRGQGQAPARGGAAAGRGRAGGLASRAARARERRGGAGTRAAHGEGRAARGRADVGGRRRGDGRERRRGAALAGSGARWVCLFVWLGLPGRIRLSAPTRPFAECRIREVLGKGGNFAECPDPAVGIDFFF